jgi:hypothetical protein
LPEPLRRRPFWFEYDEPAQMADAILAAVDSEVADRQWDDVANEFSTGDSARRLEIALQALARRRGETQSSAPINPLGFDLRLGRHHEVGGGTNKVDQPIVALCNDLLRLPDASLAEFARRSDPELAMAERFALEFGKANSALGAQKERVGGFRENFKRLFVTRT